MSEFWFRPYFLGGLEAERGGGDLISEGKEIPGCSQEILCCSRHGADLFDKRSHSQPSPWGGRPTDVRDVRQYEGT